MNTRSLSSKYTVSYIDEKDIDDVYCLSKENRIFYFYCPPFVTKESIAEDMKALPPGKTMEDKYYIGFWDKNKLAAVADVILRYPDDNTAFIGLFMMDKSYQGKGEGSFIVTEMINCLKKEGFSAIRLAYAKGNMQSRYFWIKNGFAETGEEKQNTGYTAVIMQRNLS